jgi:very-short-patch-repair endonuclease
VFDEIRDRQRGVLTRAQALACGMSVGAIRARLRTGQWQPIYRSTFATFSGPVPRESNRKKVSWREELVAALGDVAAGAQSSLELRYLRDVERAHGLPGGSRQQAVIRPGGRYYDDVRYPEFGVVVELDGRPAHPDEARWRDIRRDNTSVAQGRRVLRYGWADVTARPCDVAAQVGEVLHACGWTGAARSCRADCSVPGKDSITG